MNLRRAIWIAIAAYAVSFILGVISMIMMGVDATQLAEISNTVIIVNIIITLIVAVLFTLIYFRNKKIKPGAREGFFFGLVLVIIGFILDVIMFSLSSAITGEQQSIATYYSNPLFWLALALLLVVTTMVGMIKRKI